MENQDPLSNFLGNLAERIKTAKEHKNIMEAVYSAASATEGIKEQEDPFAKFLKKIGNAVSEKLPVSVQPEPAVVVEEIKEDPTAILGKKIKEAIETAKNKQPEQKKNYEQPEPTQSEPPTQPSDDENKPVRELAQKIKDAIENAKTEALNPRPSVPAAPSVVEDEQISSYIDELEKIKDTGTVQQKEEATTSLKELKKYIDKTVQDYARRILDLGSGGGSVAVQYARGGTMDGTLNINGQILSGGKDISLYFGTGGGGGGGDPAVNTVVYTGSGNWNSTYTTVNTYSGTWSTGIQTLAFDEDTAQLSISNGNTISLSALSGAKGPAGDPAVNTAVYTGSGNWNSTYTTVAAYSGTWSTGIQDLSFNEDTALLSISNGNTVSLSALSGNKGPAGDPAVNTAVYTGSARWDSTYTNTNYFSAFWNAAVDELFTFYVTQTDPGSAFISEDGNYYIIANSKLDNVNLWNLAYTQIYLLSSRWDSVYVTVLGTSARWESVYTSFNQNSAKYESVYTTTRASSGSWSSVYNTYRSLSASYAAETLAIAYAVAL